MAIDTATVSPDTIRARVARLPRIPFAFVPTPLEEAPKLWPRSAARASWSSGTT